MRFEKRLKAARAQIQSSCRNHLKNFALKKKENSRTEFDPTSKVEAYYKGIINQMSDGFFTLDNKLRYTFVNKKICEITGKDSKQLIGKYIWDVFPEAVGSETYRTINRAHAEKKELSNIDYYKPLHLWQENNIYPTDEGLSIFVKDFSETKKAETAFQKKELYFQTLLESSEDIIALSNKNGELIFISPALERLTGFTKEEVLGKNPGFLMHPDYAQSSKKIYEQLLKNPGIPIERTNRFITKNGDYIWVEGTVINLLNDENIGAIVSNYRDVTKRKAAEDSLRKNEELYKNLFQNLVHGFAFCSVIYEKDTVVDYSYVSVNKKYESLVGSKNPSGKKASEFFPDYKNAMRLYFEIINRVINTKKVEIVEHHAEQQDKWYSLTFYSPQTDHFVCLLEDITENKKFNEQQILFASIVNSSDDAIISTNLSGTIISWNYGAEKIYGYKAKEAIGLKIATLIPTDRRKEDINVFQKIINGKRIDHYETSRIKKNGETIYISLTMSPIRDVEGKIIGISKIAKDITEQKKLSEQNALAASIITYTQDAIFSRDLSGYITSWNTSAERHFGYSEQEAIGMHMKNLIPRELLHEWDEVDTKIKQGIRIVSFETMRKTKNGQLIWVALTISPVLNLEKKTVGYSIIARDISDKKTNEEKIKYSENNLHTIIENSTEEFVLLDSEFSIKAFNSKAVKSVLLQFGKAKITHGSNFLDFIHKERRSGVKEILLKVLKDESFQYESDFYKKDGKTYWFRASFTPVKKNNRVSGVCIAVKDITRRKLNELKIKQSEENLRAIFENSTQGFILLDSDGTIKLFNEKAIEFSFSAYGRHMKPGKVLYDYIDKSRVPFLKNIISRVLKGETVNYSRLYERTTNKKIWIEFSISPVISDQQIIGVCITGNDITEKKRIETERLFDQQNLESLINNTSDLMWSINRKFRLITYNKPFENLVKSLSGISVIKGSSILIKEFGAEKLRRYKQFYKRAFSGESFTEIERNDFPKTSWTETSFYPIFGNEGVIGTACFSKDITERKMHEEQLRENSVEKENLIKELTQNNKDLRQFAYITSHNMRGPIANLLGLSSLLNNYEIKDPTMAKILDGIKTSSLRFDETIKDLTSILSIKDNVSVPKEKLLFSKSLGKALIQCSASIEASKAKIYSDFSAAAAVSFNKSYLESIFINLLTNALKYRDYSRPPKITISTKTTENGIILKFSDNGIGLDVELHKHKIFQLYQRFHDEREGKGLGLYLIKSQLDAFGGSITIDSKLNEGTQFTLFFKQ